MDLCLAVQLAVETHQHGVGEGPGLVFIVADVLHVESRLFQHLPAHRILQRLADLHEAGDEGGAAVGAVSVAGQQQLIAIRHRHNDGGRDLGILDEATLGAIHGPLDLAGLHLGAAAAAVSAALVPPVQLGAGDGGKGHLHRPHSAQRLIGTILPPLAQRVLRRVRVAEIAAHAVESKEVPRRGQLRPQLRRKIGKAGQGPHIFRHAPQQHLTLPVAQGIVLLLRRTEAVRAVIEMTSDILNHHILLSFRSFAPYYTLLYPAAQPRFCLRPYRVHAILEQRNCERRRRHDTR